MKNFLRTSALLKAVNINLLFTLKKADGQTLRKGKSPLENFHMSSTLVPAPCMYRLQRLESSTVNDSCQGEENSTSVQFF